MTVVRLIIREWSDELETMQIVDIQEFDQIEFRSDGNPSGSFGSALRNVLRNLRVGQYLEISMRMIDPG